MKPIYDIIQLKARKHSLKLFTCFTGVPRQTDEEKEFADFDIFDDPKAPYSTFKFQYSHKTFERLHQLMEFNTLMHVETIKDVIADCMVKKS